MPSFSDMRGKAGFLPALVSPSSTRPALNAGLTKDQRMFASRSVLLAVAGILVSYPAAHAGVLRESFNSEPSARGWSAFGDTRLFSWDAGQQHLQVTWDSSRPNSYFYHPLGTILAKDDDFSLEFDLFLSDIATGSKSGPFEIAVGFINLDDATSPNFGRGSGVDPVHGPRNLVEFDYFPAGFYPDWGDVAASLSPTLVSRDNFFASGFTLVELNTNEVFHVRLAYTAADQTLRTSITLNGASFVAVADVKLTDGFSDFRVNAVAVCSYSDAGDSFDSVIAHGHVDDFAITLPDSPADGASGRWAGQAWQVTVPSRTNWVYSLEKTSDFQSWSDVTGGVFGSGKVLTLEDQHPETGHGFYRVRASRP
jgi:hypothetical protein